MAFVLKQRRHRSKTPQTDEGAGLIEDLVLTEAESSMLDSNSAPELLGGDARDGGLEEDAKRRALARLRRLTR